MRNVPGSLLALRHVEDHRVDQLLDRRQIVGKDLSFHVGEFAVVLRCHGENHAQPVVDVLADEERLYVVKKVLR